jgi:O-antigen ligase
MAFDRTRTLRGALAGSVAAAVSADRSPTAFSQATGRLASAQSNRYEYWRVAAGSFAANPLLGVGSGGFQVEWLRERRFEESVRDAHSLYLETAAELGFAGLAALLVMLGGVAAAARRAAAPGATAACAAWALHAGLDWDWEMPALTVTALVLAAALCAAAEPAPPRSPAAPAG